MIAKRSVAIAAILFLLQNSAFAISCELQCLADLHLTTHQHMRGHMGHPSGSAHVMHDHHGNGASAVDSRPEGEASHLAPPMVPFFTRTTQVQTCNPVSLEGSRFKFESSKSSDAVLGLTGIQAEIVPVTDFTNLPLMEGQPPGLIVTFLILRI